MRHSLFAFQATLRHKIKLNDDDDDDNSRKT